VAVGVLLDTFLVRSLLVPALALDVGPKIWWPSRLASTRSSGGGREPHDSVLVGASPRRVAP
jgi:RND superfamily putative drug exporter